MTGYSHVLFDADDTIFDFQQAQANALSTLARQTGILDTSELLLLFDRKNKMLWKKLERGEITREDMQNNRFSDVALHYRLSCSARQLNDLFVDALSQQSCLLPGALDLLRRLSGQCTVLLATNGLKKVQRGRYARSEPDGLLGGRGRGGCDIRGQSGRKVCGDGGVSSCR